MKTCRLFVLFLFAAWAGHAQELKKIAQLDDASPDYVISHWGMADGLPSDRVREVLQSQNGFVWVATFNGLARFDGERFKVFDDANTPELKNRLCNRLDEDSKGRLWIGSDTGAITWLDRAGFHVLPTQKGWRISPILKMVNMPDGSLVVINRYGQVLRVKDGTAELLMGGPGSVIYTDVVVDNNDHAWLLQRSWQVHQLGNGKKVMNSPGPPATDYYRNIAPARQGGYWVRDGQRLRRWQNGGWVEDRGIHDWDDQRPVVMKEISTGDVVVGTDDQGLFIIGADGGERHLTRANGLSHNWVTSIFEDHENNLWIGLNGGGLDLLRPRVLTMLSPRDRWQNQPVQSVSPAGDGGVWIGTLGAGVYRYDGKNFFHLRDTNVTHSAYVRGVLEDHAGRLWVGTEAKGLYWWQNGTFGKPDIPQANLVYGLSQSRNGDIWVSLSDDVIRVTKTDAGIQYQRLGKGLHQADVRAAVQAADGDMWIGMRGGGVARWQDGKFKQFLPRDGLPYAYVWSLFADKDGSVWIGTSGGGLARYRNGKFDNFTERQGLPSDFICDIEADDAGYLWVASYAGIFRAKIADLDRCAKGEISTVNCLVLDTSDGLTSLEMAGGNQPAGCRTPDGRLWFGTSGGLAMLDPKRLKINRTPPPVVIEEMVVNGNPVKDSQSALLGMRENLPELVVPPGSDQIEFKFAALSFSSPKRVQFKYQMSGLNSTWVNAGGLHSAFYPHLPPGHYEFKVLACNRFGYWTLEAAGLRFEVQPFIWQTWWFGPACWLVGVALAGFLVINGLRRRHQRKMEVLERARLVDRERARIAHDLHDDLGTGLTEIDTTSALGLASDISPHEMHEYFEEISQRARGMVTALDEIVWAANPKNDNVGSVAAYFSHFTEQFLRPTSIQCRFEMADKMPPIALDSSKRHSLFLALKEALNNAVRHSQAKNITFALHLEDQVMRLTVRDDGCGLGTAADHPGADGLANMRHRLEDMGGRCEITSEPGAGTRVTFIVPLS